MLVSFTLVLVEAKLLLCFFKTNALQDWFRFTRSYCEELVVWKSPNFVAEAELLIIPFFSESSWSKRCFFEALFWFLEFRPWYRSPFLLDPLMMTFFWALYVLKLPWAFLPRLSMVSWFEFSTESSSRESWSTSSVVLWPKGLVIHPGSRSGESSTGASFTTVQSSAEPS